MNARDSYWRALEQGTLAAWRYGFVQRVVGCCPKKNVGGGELWAAEREGYVLRSMHIKMRSRQIGLEKLRC